VARRLGVPRRRASGTLLRVAEAQPPEGLDEFFARLRQEWASSFPRPETTIFQGRPIARTTRVGESDTADVQRQGEKSDDPDRCNDEGWVLHGLTHPEGHGEGSDLPVPISVWCSRPAGHNGDHEARIGRGVANHHEIDVARWSHPPST